MLEIKVKIDTRFSMTIVAKIKIRITIFVFICQKKKSKQNLVGKNTWWNFVSFWNKKEKKGRISKQRKLIILQATAVAFDIKTILKIKRVRGTKDFKFQLLLGFDDF